MLLKNRLLRVPHALFAILLLIEFIIPNQVKGNLYTAYLVATVGIIEVIFLISSFIINDEEGIHLFSSVIGVIYTSFIGYSFVTEKLNLIDERFFPSMGSVIHQLFADHTILWKGLLSSINIVFTGYIIALLVALPLGLILAYNKKTRKTAAIVAGFLSAIPPVVFIPYGIALLPTFHAASVFVIFVAAFWPIFTSTMSGVINVDSDIIKAATVLEIRGFKLLFKIILPAALPQVFIGCNQGLGLSFILLTSAEMIGASQGLGYYIKTYSNFGDFKRVMLGIICVGIVVVVISFLIRKLQERLLCWKN